MTNHASKTDVDDDYGFDEVDLISARPAPQGHIDEPLSARESLVSDAASQVTPEAQVDQAPQAKKQKAEKVPSSNATKSNYALYGSVGAVALLIFGGIGYWTAHTYLPASRAPRATFRNEAPAQFNANSMTVAPQIDDDSASARPAARPAILKQGPSHVEAAPVIRRESEQPVGAVSTSQDQDDAFYDQMAEEAGKEPLGINSASPTPAHLEAITVPTSTAVVPQTAAVQQVVQGTPAIAPDLTAITDQLKKNSADIADVLGAVKAVQATIGDLKKQIDEEGAKSGKLAGQLTLLDTRLTDLTQTTQARFTDLSKDAVSAALAAVRKSEGAGGKPGARMVLVGGPVVPVEPPAQQRPRLVPQRQEIKIEPKQVTQPAVVASAGDNSSGNSQCSAKTVSQIWHVKGVSASAAYIRRDVDGAGLMVRMDMDVPGFGTVKSFDPTARTVCTSNGLIVR